MRDNNYEILVKNIEMLMQNKNMIPADLIRETGISQSQVSKALSRTQKTQFTFEQIWTIADYFKVSIDYLVGRKPTAAITEQSSNKEICKVLIQLIESDVVTYVDMNVEEDMYEEVIPPNDNSPYELKRGTNPYKMFYFSNYINPDVEGLDEVSLGELSLDFLISGNYNQKSNEINDFIDYFLKLYDLYKHNKLKREFFDQAISDRLDNLKK
ncbi:helix-turn-helix domain-containing protein [Lachnoanaerobaculum saburreum]|uniref:HTH cro/C1-type domain-containing protein n=1 Tax=Lachnoanaerobaculum saburreum TaxID=467210 RepID=A0A133ZZM3_9FIRM|nr:helix-turn-helix transcriptional regulator [Lachnoanaerobaculum saburreum]KXB60877.1 hypothetical protein HMPREF1866_00328 [Lachnoanaerobaculum saburreum]